MSNHSGSYLLNHVLLILKKYNFFKSLTKKQLQEFVNEIIGIGMDYDCNPGEILNEIGVELGICYQCTTYAINMNEDGMCKKCYPW